MTSVAAAARLTMPANPGGPLATGKQRPGGDGPAGPANRRSLGGVLYAFRRGGACLGLLCLTRGEASPLNSSVSARLEAIRPWELQLAASVLGISRLAVANYPDGELRCYPAAELAERVRRAIRQHSRGPAAGHRPG